MCENSLFAACLTEICGACSVLQGAHRPQSAGLQTQMTSRCVSPAKHNSKTCGLLRLQMPELRTSAAAAVMHCKGITLDIRARSYCAMSRPSCTGSDRAGLVTRTTCATTQHCQTLLCCRTRTANALRTDQQDQEGRAYHTEHPYILHRSLPHQS